MLQYHICALFNQNFRRICFFGRVKPSIGPNDFKLYVWVHCFGVDIGRVDAADHFWNWEGANVTNDIGFGHLARNMALNRTAFIKARRINRDVVSLLITCGMFELHIWEFGRNIDGWVHIAKGGGEDQICAFQRHICHDTLCVRSFWNVFHIHGFDLIAKSFHNGLAALVMLIGPTAVSDRADINKAHLGFFGQRARGRCHRQCGAG